MIANYFSDESIQANPLKNSDSRWSDVEGKFFSDSSNLKITFYIAYYLPSD